VELLRIKFVATCDGEGIFSRISDWINDIDHYLRPVVGPQSGVGELGVPTVDVVAGHCTHYLTGHMGPLAADSVVTVEVDSHGAGHIQEEDELQTD